MLVKELDNEIASILGKEGRMTICVTLAFDSTICGYHDGLLITILDGRKKVLPMSIVVEGELKGRNYSIGDKITISGNDNSDFVISEFTRSTDLRMPNSGDNSIISCKYIDVRTALDKLDSETKGMLPIISMLGLLKKQKEYEGIEASMYRMVAKRTAELLSGLEDCNEITSGNIVGYGIGLTPSADDFLLGISGVLDYFGEQRRKELLAAYVEKSIGTTTEVSGWMLKYGLRNRLYPEIIMDYLGQPASERLRIEDFLKHGSSSGIDLLCGLLCGLQIIGKTELNS